MSAIGAFCGSYVQKFAPTLGVVEGDRHGCFVLCGVEEVENAQRLPLNKNVSKASFM
jgi:hypothetical protein